MQEIIRMNNGKRQRISKSIKQKILSKKVKAEVEQGKVINLKQKVR